MQELGHEEFSSDLGCVKNSEVRSALKNVRFDLSNLKINTTGDHRWEKTKRRQLCEFLARACFTHPRSLATETRCLRDVRLSLNLRHAKM